MIIGKVIYSTVVIFSYANSNVAKTTLTPSVPGGSTVIFTGHALVSIHVWSGDWFSLRRLIVRERRTIVFCSFSAIQSHILFSDAKIPFFKVTFPYFFIPGILILVK